VFYIDLPDKYGEFLCQRGVAAELAVHQFENRFEFVLQLGLLKERNQDFKFDILRELVDGILDQLSKELVQVFLSLRHFNFEVILLLK
jgi:hypothetical protein